ncbi:MAG: hypothetical protein EA377_01515 [Phycisphaerales bacterium]|nr:MAG: hypothetical protein EA377_01515 [Phycisphaerales bacterium]
MLVQGRLLIDPHKPPVPGWVRVEGGRIAEVGEGDSPALPAAGGSEAIITPGFIDAHLHLPQIDAIGCDGLELLEWLERVIFPAELKWGNAGFAQQQIDEAHQRLLRAGTLGYAGYLTSHGHGIGGWIDSLRRFPLRATAGQVLMDRAGPPALTNQVIEPLRGVPGDRASMSVNPRFAVSCSGDLLKTVAPMSAGLFMIQTHLAESKRECEVVLELFKECESYTDVYERFGMLTQRTLLAHAVHLSEAEWRLIAERDSVVVHCPGANTFLEAGAFDLHAAREHGVRLALGSDVAAGPDLAMPRVARSMIEVAKLRRILTGQSTPVPSPAEAWKMITRGNAEALGWQDAGLIEPGARADLLVLQPPFEIDEHLIGRLIYTWRDAMIAARIVDGRLIDVPAVENDSPVTAGRFPGAAGNGVD